MQISCARVVGLLRSRASKEGRCRILGLKFCFRLSDLELEGCSENRVFLLVLRIAKFCSFCLGLVGEDALVDVRLVASGQEVKMF